MNNRTSNKKHRAQRSRSHSGRMRGSTGESRSTRGGGQRSQRPGANSVDDLIMGRNCLHEVALHAPHRLREVFFAETRDEASVAGSSRKKNLYQIIEDLGVPIRECRRDDLDSLVQSESHQGVVARVSPRNFVTLEELVEQATNSEKIRILALDGVLDPHNFGAILRAAECFGVAAVIWSRNRAAPLGPVVSKVSVGASEIVPLCPVANLHRALEALKSSGVWSIGAMVSPTAIPLESFDSPSKWVVVMGSEGDGMQSLIERNLDFQVYIEMFGELSSLNVSQATAVMLHSLKTGG